MERQRAFVSLALSVSRDQDVAEVAPELSLFDDPELLCRLRLLHHLRLRRLSAADNE
jgi:hypothetical protein